MTDRRAGTGRTGRTGRAAEGQNRRMSASPRRVDPGRGPWPLHDIARSQAAEVAALACHPAHALMERAGLAVARLARALQPHAERVTLWCGPGNNGGDGFVAARHLHAQGTHVRVRWIGNEARMPDDAREALRRARAAGVAITPWDGGGDRGDERPADLAIDALLGLGTRRAPEGPVRAAIEAMSAERAPVLAVDLPSGLHADTGQPLGDLAVRADATLALLTLKPGLFTGQGRDFAGAVWWDALGVEAPGPTAWLSGPPVAPPETHATHKGERGDVYAVGGAPGMAGAVWLAARAALAAGAGRVYVSPLDDSAAAVDIARPELMHRHAAWALAPSTLGAATVVCGCGGGTAVRASLPALLAHAGRLVLDADALNAIALDLPLQALLRARAAQGLSTLLTPHPLEAARLLGLGARDVQADRLASARGLAERFGCAVVLKGSGSVVAAPEVVPCINPTGNAALATAGTGDVLAGWAAGLWARQPAAAASAIGAAAAWTHGDAADRHRASGRHGPLRAAELVDRMAP